MPETLNPKPYQVILNPKPLNPDSLFPQNHEVVTYPAKPPPPATAASTARAAEAPPFFFASFPIAPPPSDLFRACAALLPVWEGRGRGWRVVKEDD